MNRHLPTPSRPVTLRQNDSINLTTGKITRSVATANVRFPAHLSGLRANDLETLASLLRINGYIGHIGFSCRGRAGHGPTVIAPDHHHCKH